MTNFSEFGIPRNLGTITPNSSDWTEFPETANFGNTILIARYSGDFSRIRSFIYLREIYSTEPKTVSKNWIKLHPKPEREVINVFFNPEFFNQGLRRRLEAIKWFKYRIPGRNPDGNYSVSLTELSILPQYIKLYREMYVNQQSIQEITAAIVQELRRQETG